MAATTKARAGSAPDNLARKLRAVIEERDMTAYALGKRAGVDAGIIQRFINAERGLTLETVEKLAEVLGLRLMESGPGPGRPRGRGRPRSRPGQGGDP